MPKKRILVLGAEGMLGRAIWRMFLNENSFAVSGTARRSSDTFLQFDVLKNPLAKLEVEKFDYIVNCVGLIKQKFENSSVNTNSLAKKINTEFSHDLAAACETSNTKIIQIATDCVFSGKKGNYSESDVHDPTDVYGLTKSKGEVKSNNVINLRTSIVGIEQQSNLSLLNWFLSQKRGAKVDGYTNHFWNGISTMHFALISKELIRSNDFFSGTFHILPKDFVSKYELLHIIAQAFNRTDIEITPTLSKNSVNRVLKTNFSEVCSKLWTQAGYNEPPTIERLINELSKELEREI